MHIMGTDAGGKCLLVALTMIVAGCLGGEEHTQEYSGESPELQYAKMVRADVRELQGGGEEGGVIFVYDLVENLAEYENEAVGEHGEVYRQIYEGAVELRDMLDAGAAQEEINAKVDELVALTDQLPGGGEEPATEGG